jgi:anti-sigma factor RsiW
MTDQGFVGNELRISCADAIELMTHYLDDALSRPDLENFEEHLARCEGCRVFLDQLRRTITLTAESRDVTVQLSSADYDQLSAAIGRQARDPGA